jgi:hypothetical protein
MKLTKKLKSQIQAAILEGVCKLYDERCPSQKEDIPPESWSHEEKRDFDLITETQYRIELEILKVFNEYS